MKKVAIISILLAISAFFITLAFTLEIDEYGTKETDLVKAAGKNICMSCIGLYDENIIDKMIEKFGGEEKKEAK